MTAVTPVRSLDAIGVGISACVMAMWGLVASDLAEQAPKVGRIDMQARAAWDARRERWVGDAVLSFGHVMALAPAPPSDGFVVEYTRSFGNGLSADAAQSLDYAMDMQLARSVNTDLAWQRALAGYGLAGPAMVAYISSATQIGPDGVAPLLAGSRLRAGQALLARAERLGETEVAAWSTLPVEVAKRFDPSQVRDSRGQWAAEPAAAAMAAELNANTRLYDEDPWARAFGSTEPEQIADRAAFEEKFGDAGRKLSAAADDWAGYPGVSRARHVEHGTQEGLFFAKRKLRKMTPNHQILIDALNAAPPTKAPLFRGAGYTDITGLQRGATIHLPMTSFSGTRSLSEWFAGAGGSRKSQPVMFELLPGARALNIGPVGTKNMTPNEWISNGAFKVVSAQREQQKLRLDPTMAEGEGVTRDVLVVKLRFVAPPRHVKVGLVAKAFDPQEQRDGDGRWAAAASRTKVKEGRAGDQVDQLFADIAEDPPSRFAGPGGSKFTSVAAPSKFASKFSAPAQSAAVEAGESKFAGTGPSKFTSRTGRTIHRTIHIVGFPTPGTVAEDNPPETVTTAGNWVADHDYKMYLPMDNIRTYAMDNQEKFTGRRRGAVDFQHIGGWYKEFENNHNPIELSESASPWDAVRGTPHIDPDEWQTVLRKTVPFWEDVRSDIGDIADRMDPLDIGEAATRAGYPQGMSKTELLVHVHAQLYMISMKTSETKLKDGTVLKRNSGILNSLCDYIAWDNPEIMGDKGRALAEFQNSNMDMDAMLNAPEPQVLTFGDGLAEGEDFDDMQGQYAITSVSYSSAIGSRGYGAPPGRMSLQQFNMVPQDYRV